MAKKQKKNNQNQKPERKLSLIRLAIVSFGVAGLVIWGLSGIQKWEENKVTASLEPWFASYVDVTATPRYGFEQLGSTQSRNVVLSFIVSSKDDACLPTWGGVYTLDGASANLDLDRRIARLRQQGGDVAISFGGLLNDEISVKCEDTDKLFQAYESIVKRYDVDTIDLDLEGEGLTNSEAGKRRAITIASLQEKLRSEGESLAVWLTLPVTPQGLTEDGTNVVRQMLDHGVDLSGVNIMTMNYGQSRSTGDSMQVASELALKETHRQLGIIYDQVGISLSNASIWGKIGATPMIGQNDVGGEVFTLSDARDINHFAKLNGISRVSMWSANRDIQCGENYVDTTVVSDSCSGVAQDKNEFSIELGNGFEGDIELNAGVVTVEDENTKAIEEDTPENSPYPIWSANATYLEGTKIVWHRNVYQAKWWSQGDLPDNPVLQAWQTPWKLIGPVLPGEKPIELPTLPIGTYPDWSGSVQYNAGDRALLGGIPYQAKWWTQGDSPAASTSNPDGSPWVALTQEQINEILGN